MISNLKRQCRLLRCFLKKLAGDQINRLLATAAWNLNKWMRVAALLLLQLIRLLPAAITPLRLIRLLKTFFMTDSFDE